MRAPTLLGARQQLVATSHEAEPNARTLRLWARENGFDVPARGRIPELAREAYKVANSHRDVTVINRLLAPGSSPR